jgi:hypothetical protein
MVIGPGIALIIAGALGIMINTYGIFQWLAQPDQKQLEMQQAAAWMSTASGIPVQALSPGVVKVLIMLCMAVSLVILMAGVRMIYLQSYWLAVVGSILSMVNIGMSVFCCCLGLPAGIWALVVLMLPSVRDAFQ